MFPKCWPNITISLFILGGQSFYNNAGQYGGYRQDILLWKPNKGGWEEKGLLKRARTQHAASVIEFDENVLY